MSKLTYSATQFLSQQGEISWHCIWSETSMGWRHKQHSQQEIGQNFRSFLPTTSQSRHTLDDTSAMAAKHVLIHPHTNLKPKHSRWYKSDNYVWLENIHELQMLASHMHISQFLKRRLPPATSHEYIWMNEHPSNGSIEITVYETTDTDSANTHKIPRYILLNEKRTQARVGFPVVQAYSLLHSVQTGSGAHPASLSNGYRRLFRRGKEAGAWSWPLTSI
jgi:hypothetical protein